MTHGEQSRLLDSHTVTTGFSISLHHLLSRLPLLNLCSGYCTLTHTYSLSLSLSLFLLSMLFITVATAVGWEADLSPLVGPGPKGRHGNDPSCLKRKTCGHLVWNKNSLCVFVFWGGCYTYSVLFIYFLCLYCSSIRSFPSLAGGEKETVLHSSAIAMRRSGEVIELKSTQHSLFPQRFCNVIMQMA